MLSITEENYLKALLQLTFERSGKKDAGTNEIAVHLDVKPATVNDMLKKLKEKSLVSYEKYGKSSLTKEGKKKAIEIVRKHRLWETFLFQKLEFSWDEVHEVAEQLEHIQSQKLIDKLDTFLNHPSFDPHGDSIPDARGNMKFVSTKTLSEELVGHTCTVVAVKDNSASFLQYANKIGLGLHSSIKLIGRQEFDGLTELEINGKNAHVSSRFAEHIVIVCKDCIQSTKGRRK